MRYLLASAASLALFVSAANAADAVGATPVNVAPSAHDWTGFHVGAHVGFGWGDIEDVNNAGARGHDTDGIIGGVQAGYNLQAGSIVYGVEADITLSDMHADWGGAHVHDPYYGRDRQEYFGTVRGRVGYAMDRVLPYVHGGLAWSKNEHGFGCDAGRVSQTNGCKKGPFYVKDSDFVVGWTVGAGVEMAIIDNWSMKVEYAYTDYGKNGLRLVDPNIDASDYRNNRKFETSSQTIKLGLNYRF